MSSEPHRGALLGITDLATVLNDTYQCRAKWYNLGIQLRVDVGTLDCFQVKYGDPGDQLREVLRTWLTSSGKSTWEGMAEALNSPVIEEALLAEELQQKYCPSGQPPVDGRLTPLLEAALLTPPLEAAPLTPPPLAPPTHPPLAPPTPCTNKGASSPQLSPSVGELPSQPPTKQLKGVQAHPLSVEEEIKQFEEKYADLVVSVRNAFKKGGVSFEKVQNRLLQLPVSLKQYARLLQSEASRLARASSIDELFFILSPHWDFLNPSLLAHLAYRFGDERTIRSVDEYLGELREFRMQTKISSFIDMWTGVLPPDTQEIVMELGDNWKEQSLEKLEEFRIEVSRKRCFEDYVMPLKRIKISSVDAIFSLPESVDYHCLELESLQEFFREHQVLRILLNGASILNLQLQQPPSVTDVKSMHTEGDVEMEKAQRPSAEEQLEAVRAQIEGPYGSQLVKVDVVKVGMVKALKEKDKGIGRLQHQLEENRGRLEAEVEIMNGQLQQKDAQLQQKDAQLQQNHAQLQQRDAQLHHNHVQLQQKDAQLQYKDAQIQERDAEVETLREDKGRLQAEVGAKTTQLERQRSNLHERANENSRLQIELLTLREDKRRLQAEVGAKTTQLERQASNLRERANEVSRLQGELQTLRAFKGETVGAQQQVQQLKTWPQRKLQTPLKLWWRKGRDMLFGMSLYPKTVQLHTILYMGGGYSFNNCTVLQYECTTDSWSKLPQYQCYRFGMSLINGRHLTLVGGRDRRTDQVTNKLGVWDPSSQQWTQPYPPMITPRCLPEVATYNNYLLAAGGYGGDRKLTTVEVLDVRASEQWLTATQLPIPCSLKTSAILHDNWYVITDSKQVMYTSLPELCTTPQTVTKSNTRPAQWRRLPDAPLERSTAIVLHGSLLTVGGRHDNTASTAIHLYHPETSTWTKIGNLNAPRYYSSVTLLSSSEFLVSGGEGHRDELTTLVDIATIVD